MHENECFINKERKELNKTHTQKVKPRYTIYLVYEERKIKSSEMSTTDISSVHWLAITTKMSD